MIRRRLTPVRRGPRRFYVGDVLTALERRDAFNVIDATTGWKVDFIVRRDRPYSETEFERRRPAERQIRDVRAIVRTVGESLDKEYLARWAAELGVTNELEGVLPANF